MASKTKKILLDVRENRGGNLDYTLIAAFAKAPFQTTNSQLLISPFLRRNPKLIRKIVWGNQAKIFEDEFTKNPDIERTSMRPFFCVTPACESKESVISNTGELSQSRLWVLVGPQCMSACDQVISIFKENQIAKLVGMNSQGASSPYRLEPEFQLANGVTFSLVLAASANYGPNGNPIEGHPAALDIEIPPSQLSQGKYLRTILQRIAF